MTLFEKMKEKNLEKDIVAYMNGVRSAGFCRPWTYTLELLNTAFSEFENKNEILPIICTVITNLKYFERGLRWDSLGSLSRLPLCLLYACWPGLARQ